MEANWDKLIKLVTNCGQAFFSFAKGATAINLFQVIDNLFSNLESPNNGSVQSDKRLSSWKVAFIYFDSLTISQNI